MGRPGGSLENARVLRIHPYFCRLGRLAREKPWVGQTSADSPLARNVSADIERITPACCNAVSGILKEWGARRSACHSNRDDSTLGKAPRLLVPIRTGDIALVVAKRPAVPVNTPRFGSGLHRCEKRGALLVAGSYLVNGGRAAQGFAAIALRPGRARPPLSGVVPTLRTLTIAERFRAEPPAFSRLGCMHYE
jgi:hypothetical protein